MSGTSENTVLSTKEDNKADLTAQEVKFNKGHIWQEILIVMLTSNH